MNDPSRDLIQLGLRRAWLLWSAMFATIVVFVVMVQFFASQLAVASGPAGLGDRLTYVFFGIAALAFFVSIMIRRQMLRGSPLAAGQAAPSTRPAAAAVGRYLMAVVVSNALAESIAVIAIVTLILGFDRATSYTLVFISAAAMLILRPRLAELAAYANALQRR